VSDPRCRQLTKDWAVINDKNPDVPNLRIDAVACRPLSCFAGQLCRTTSRPSSPQVAVLVNVMSKVIHASVPSPTNPPLPNIHPFMAELVDDLWHARFLFYSKQHGCLHFELAGCDAAVCPGAATKKALPYLCHSGLP